MFKKIPLFIAIGFIAVTSFIGIQANAFANSSTDYCSLGNYGYNPRVSQSSYTSGQTVNFCLRDDTRTALYANPSWEIRNSQNQVVYQSAGGLMTPTPTYIYYGTWNQMDSHGVQVPAGTYTLYFTQFPNQPSIQFTIQSNTTSNVATNLPLPSNLLTTIWNPISLTNNSLTNYYLLNGATTTFNGTIANYGYNQPQTVLVFIGIYNQSNNLVAQQTWDNVSLNPFTSSNFSMTSPSNLPAGNYYFTVGVFTQGGHTLLGWYPKYQNFTVGQ